MKKMAHHKGTKVSHQTSESTINPTNSDCDRSISVLNIPTDPLPPAVSVTGDSLLLERIISSSCYAVKNIIDTTVMALPSTKAYHQKIRQGTDIFHWMKRDVEDSKRFVPHLVHEIQRPLLPTIQSRQNDPSEISTNDPTHFLRACSLWQPIWDALYADTINRDPKPYALSLNPKRVKPLLTEFYQRLKQTCPCSQQTLGYALTEIDSISSTRSTSLLVNRQAKFFVAHIVTVLTIHKDVVSPCGMTCKKCPDRVISDPSIFETVSLLMHLILTSTDIVNHLPTCSCVTIEEIAAFFGGFLFYQAGLPFTLEQVFQCLIQPSLVSCCTNDIDAFAMLLVDELVGKWLNSKTSLIIQCEQEVKRVRAQITPATT